MTLKKPMPLTLLLFTIMCALPATTTAVILIPSAIAQEDDDMSLDEAENLASDTVSNVLDNDNTAGDNTDTNTQLSVPLTDQDQTAANFGLSGALDVTVERTLSAQEEEVPPEGTCDPFTTDCFCYRSGEEVVSCFPTELECLRAQTDDPEATSPCVLVGPG
jgi:hypothetical protein